MENNLTEHILNKYAKFQCRECKVRLETKDILKEQIAKKHTMIECQICNFKAENKEQMSQHVGALHNKMNKCEYESIIENNTFEHKKNKHQKEKS